jgi:hypothetical protein
VVASTRLRLWRSRRLLEKTSRAANQFVLNTEVCKLGTCRKRNDVYDLGESVLLLPYDDIATPMVLYFT